MRTQRKREQRGGGGRGPERAALGKWQAQSLRLCRGLEAGVGDTWRNPKETVVQDDLGISGDGDWLGTRSRVLGTSSGVSPAVGLGPFQLPGHYLPRQRGPCCSRSLQVPGEGPGLPALAPCIVRWEAGERATARAQLRTLGGLEHLRGFSKTSRRHGLPLFSRMVGSAVPVLCWVCGQPWLTGGRPVGTGPGGMAQLPGQRSQ